MTPQTPPDPKPGPPVAPGASSSHKSRGGLRRLWRAVGYSWHGLSAAFRHEAAFRQELAVGMPALALAWWLAPSARDAVLLSLTVLAVWVVELLNSAIEALADAVSVHDHPLLGRAKDLGSAAVMLTLLGALAAWAVVLGPALLSAMGRVLGA